MRYELQDDLDAYEAFMKTGFYSGEHPLAGNALAAVECALDDIGWGHSSISSTLLNGYIDELESPRSRVYRLAWAYHAKDGREVRDGMIKRRYPKQLIEALDRLNETKIDSFY